MAKISKAMAFKNAVINLDDMTITEIGKDTCEEFDLMKDFLEVWNKIEGISISIKQDNDIAPKDSANSEEL